MKLKIRIIAVAAALIMVCVMMAACGGGDDARGRDETCCGIGGSLGCDIAGPGCGWQRN